jgi:hypothetical protein
VIVAEEADEILQSEVKMVVMKERRRGMGGELDLFIKVTSTTWNWRGSGFHLSEEGSTIGS